MKSSPSSHITSLSNILVVDDDEDVAKVLHVVIKEMNYNVESFTDSIMIWNHFKSHPYRYFLLITDLIMPDMSGIELIRKIRKINKSIKIFILTAYNIEDHVRKDDIILLKIDRVIQKPVDIDVLKGMINEI